jgi:two-component system sensor histidine kinase UhpB
MGSFLSRNENIRIWIIEDNSGDLLLLQETLLDLNFTSRNIRPFTDLLELKEALKNDQPDVILLDLFLPGFSGIETFENVMTMSPSSPIIVLSGLDNMETALACVSKGAQDYIIKGEMDEELINKTINYSIERFKNTIELQKSEEKYRQLFTAIPVAVLSLDGALNIIDFNEASRSLMKISPPEQGGNYLELFPNEFTASEAITALAEEGRKLLKLSYPNGETYYYEQSAEVSYFGSNKRYLVTLLDRTEIVTKELNKIKIVHETLDEERNRFSRELHDGLAQNLVVANLRLEMLRGSDEKKNEIVKASQDAINSSINLLRSISYNLSPPELEKGLLAAIKALFNRLQNVNSIEFILITSEVEEALDYSYFDEYSIYRIIQEFTNNSIKYSSCNEVSCEIDYKDDELKIIIQDNGKGFDQTTTSAGIGLQNMKQRAFAAGFSMELISTLGAGTRLILTSKMVDQL